jgi:hypothetical protein
MFGYLGTNVQVFLVWRASISACIACCHCGWWKACWNEVGSCGWAARLATKQASIGCHKEKNTLGFSFPVWARVIIWWCRCGAGVG